MVYILVLFCSLLTIFTLVIFKKDLISPSFISCATFSFCSIILMLYQNEWGVSMNPITVIVIFLGLVSFTTGELLIRLSTKIQIKDNKSKLVIPYKRVVFFCVISIVSLVIYTQECYKLVGVNFSIDNFSYMLVRLRYLTVHTEASLGFIANILYYFCLAESYVVSYLLIYDIFLKKFSIKKDILYIVIIICSLIIQFFSTSRYTFFQFFSYIFVVFIFFNSNYYTVSKAFVKGLKNLFLTIMVCLLSFVFLGQFTNKSDMNMFFDSIAGYAASPVMAMDVKINQYGLGIQAEYFGETTLVGTFSTVNHILGTEIPSSRLLEFVYYNSSYDETNVYTSLYRYIHDYGFLGMLICQFLFGIIISIAYVKTKINNTPTAIILYSYYIYIVFLQCFDEEFLTTLFAPHTIMMFTFLWVISKHLIKKSNKIYEIN